MVGFRFLVPACLDDVWVLKRGLSRVGICGKRDIERLRGFDSEGAARQKNVIVGRGRHIPLVSWCEWLRSFVILHIPGCTCAAFRTC